MPKIAVIGSGVVGSATGKGFIAKGHEVVFCDINLETLGKLSSRGYRVCPMEDLENEEGCDAFFLSVSTPTVDGKIHLEFLEAAVANLGSGALKKSKGYSLTVIRSTVPPGTTERFIPLLERRSGKKAGRDFGVCMNPEYLREKSSEEDFRNPRVVVIGELDGKSGDTLQRLYLPLTDGSRLVRTSIQAAEMQKYVHNLWNACKISFFNEMREICEVLGLDADEIFRLVMQSAEASWNIDYGVKNRGAFGGSCLPKDTTAFLSWAKDELNIQMTLLRAVIRVNDSVNAKRNGLHEREKAA